MQARLRAVSVAEVLAPVSNDIWLLACDMMLVISASVTVRGVTIALTSATVQGAIKSLPTS